MAPKEVPAPEMLRQGSREGRACREGDGGEGGGNMFSLESLERNRRNGPGKTRKGH